MSKEEIEKNDNIPKNAKSRYKEFYICVNCGKIYWFGSHWTNIMKFNKMLNDALK